MRQIRSSVFETNSSSSHSISIKKCGGHYTSNEIEDSVHYCMKNGVFKPWENDLTFERYPFEPLTTFGDKLRFAIASFGEDEVMRNQIESIMYEVIPNLKDIEYPVEIYWETDEERTFYGYIDHQSLGVLSSFLKNHGVSIRDFLLDKKYVVWIDGDEYCIKEKLFESGLINKDDFVEV